MTMAMADDIGSSSRSGGFQRPPTSSSTYTGDRGGSAEDEELLAELRAISMKSSSSSRFGGEAEVVAEVAAVSIPTPTPNNDDDGNSGGGSGSNNDSDHEELISHRVEKNSIGSDTNIKLKGIAKEENDGDGGRHARDGPSADHTNDGNNNCMNGTQSTNNNTGGFQSTRSGDTYTGPRGGAAIDDELLAELRAISNKASSSNRFDSGNDNDDNHKDDGAPSTTTTTTITTNVAEFNNQIIDGKEPRRIAIPPLRSSGLTSKMNSVDNPSDSLPPPPWKRGNNAADKPWKRGATRKTKSGAAGGGDDDVDIVIAAPPAPKCTANSSPTASGPEVVVATQQESDPTNDITNSIPQLDPPVMREHANDSAVVVESKRGIQSNLPKTFVGDRGGAAEDADLLAELRAISSKTASRNRFDDDDGDSTNPSASDCVGSIHNTRVHDSVVSTKPKLIDEIKEQQAQTLPPWKQKKIVKMD